MRPVMPRRLRVDETTDAKDPIRTVAWALFGALSLVAVVLLSGCGDVVPAAHQELLAEEASRTPEHAQFVFDRSYSITNEQLERGRELMATRVLTRMHGDHLTAQEVLQRSITETPKRWSQAVPDRQHDGMVLASDSVSRQRFLRDAVTYLGSFASEQGREQIQGTDILSTLHDVAANFHATPNHRKTLVLFSDMLQSNGEIEMEGARRMPGSGWVFRAAADGRLPDLTGVCVLVVGARVDNSHGQAVKAFWKTYFDATGATLYDRNYQLRPVALPEGDPCV